MSNSEIQNAIMDVRWAAHLLDMQLSGSSQSLDLLASVRVLIQAAKDGEEVEI